MDLLGSIVAANPCPPLPLQVMREDCHAGDDIYSFANTHHVLMQAYVHAMRRDCVKDNEQREKTQIELTQTLQSALCDSQKDPNKIYNSCTKFTLAYLHSCMPERPVIDSGFAPYSDVASGTYTNNNII